MKEGEGIVREIVKPSRASGDTRKTFQNTWKRGRLPWEGMLPPEKGKELTSDVGNSRSKDTEGTFTVHREN